MFYWDFGAPGSLSPDAESPSLQTYRLHGTLPPADIVKTQRPPALNLKIVWIPNMQGILIEPLSALTKTPDRIRIEPA